MTYEKSQKKVFREL